MKWLIFLLLIPLVSAIDSQINLQPGFDNQLISDYFPDEQLIFSGGVLSSPVVTLLYPLNGGEDSDLVVEFGYSVNSLLSITNCSLYLDGDFIDSNTNVTVDTSYQFTIHLAPKYVKNDLNWYISCFDSIGNEGVSDTYLVDTLVGSGTFGGGGSGGPFIGGFGLGVQNISLGLCELAYDSADNSDYSRISDIQSGFKVITNQSTTYTQVKFYIDNWQGLCSDLINKSLKSEFVCNQIYENIKTDDLSIDNVEFDNLLVNIRKVLPISSYLLNYYINNYESSCSQFPNKTLTIAGEGKTNYTYLWIIIIFIIFLVAYLNRKKLLSYFD